MSSAEDQKPADPPSAAALDDQDEDQLVDEDAAIVELVTELKEEGTTLFRRRDYDGAAFMFDEAIRLSPRCAAAAAALSSARPQSRNQLDEEIASLHSNVAACYMHMGTDDEDRHYRQAIERCNMALEASPRYAKALLKRARCYEALDRLDLACADVRAVLGLEPNNVVALELRDSLREEMEEKKLLLEQEARSLDDLIGLISAASQDGDRSGKTNEQPNGGANYGLLQDTQEIIHDDEHTGYDASGGEEAHSSLSEEEHAGEIIDQLDIKEEEGAGTDGNGDALEKENAGQIAVDCEARKESTDSGHNVGVDYEATKESTDSGQNVVVDYEATKESADSSQNVVVDCEATKESTDSGHNVVVDSEATKESTDSGQNVVVVDCEATKESTDSGTQVDGTQDNHEAVVPGPDLSIREHDRVDQ